MEQKPLTGDDVFTLIGHAKILRGQGQSDMPAYFLDLAARIAGSIGDDAMALRVRQMEEESRAAALVSPAPATPPEPK